LSDATIERLGSIGTVVAAWVGLVGVIVLFMYTREAFLLRKTAEQQNENAVRPILLFELSSNYADGGSQMQLADPALRNIGSGPALNITIKPIEANGIVVGFTDVPLLEVRGKPILTYIVQGGERNGVSRFTPLLASLVMSGKLPQQMTTSVEFDSVTGKRYRTVHNIDYDADTKSLQIKFQYIEEA